MRNQRTILLAAVGYVIAGSGTAALAAVSPTPVSVKVWRAASWLLSLVIFACHFASERGRRERTPSAAAHVALAVALGAVGVAVLGPLRAHWGEPARFRLAMLSIITWPAITGVPAFIVASIAGYLLDQRSRALQS